jgi:hypothetical protein
MIELYINVQLINCDTCIRESVVRNDDDSYTVFINAKLTHEKQLEVYQHAVNHIENADFDKCNADKIELDAHSA